MKISSLLLCTILFATIAEATLRNDKIVLMPNMVVQYKQTPGSVDSISEVFTEGMLYGRLRTNMFMWDWDAKSEFDNKAMGVGGSFVYKTASLSGFSTTLGLYTTQNPAWFRESVSDIGNIKSGKDTFSRYDTKTSGDFGMIVLGQAYLQYGFSKNSVKIGRQMFESVFTKSNDTKMIPNTFDGVTLELKEIPKNTIQLAYLDKQKLRDHTTAHDVIAVADGSSPQSWSQNDDSAINKNLTVSRIGDDNELFIATLENRSIKQLRVDVSYLIVPDVISNLTLETSYAIQITEAWKVTPAVRYMQQFDHLNANYGVANLGANQQGYTSPNSLDTNLLALRLDLRNKALLVRFGYSEVADKADIIAPWRGFPTGGFTRAMAQYNWYANTKTSMLRADYDFEKAGILDGFSIMARYVVQDFDDNKAGVQADANVIHVDARQNIGQNLEAKIRLGFVDAENKVGQTDASYNEYRFELNYFF